ncbi:hypothetical protein BDV36DRAFT_295094 [Aspergillus pseudocaelatus]|uniref:Uncharacterized protein n=1 Tax=Aspergillus pseudocaelatus TaxID=1825620 RepID=A0ABQ6WMU7_9EURO|nr:hypothetical protein BDV36DRAFT_295094 [Aspergillus pseudocaelatus]
MTPLHSSKKGIRSTTTYTRWGESEESIPIPNQTSQVRTRTGAVIIQVIVTSTIALTLGLIIGQRLSVNKWDGLIREKRIPLIQQMRNGNILSPSIILVPQGNVKTVWEHNLTFSQRPTPESEAAWSSIIPGKFKVIPCYIDKHGSLIYMGGGKQVGRGFIHHPEIAPFISNIAVFHQLHCLHAILVAYYAAVEESDVAKGAQRPDDYLQQTGTRMAPSHIRHCFDYLRQTLMCAADTNMEVLDPQTHTTSGWGQGRQCRDYDEVVKWAEKWANSTDTGIVT